MSDNLSKWWETYRQTVRLVMLTWAQWKFQNDQHQAEGDWACFERELYQLWTAPQTEYCDDYYLTDAAPSLEYHCYLDLQRQLNTSKEIATIKPRPEIYKQ